MVDFMPHSMCGHHQLPRPSFVILLSFGGDRSGGDARSAYRHRIFLTTLSLRVNDHLPCFMQGGPTDTRNTFSRWEIVFLDYSFRLSSFPSHPFEAGV